MPSEDLRLDMAICYLTFASDECSLVKDEVTHYNLCYFHCLYLSSQLHAESFPFAFLNLGGITNFHCVSPRVARHRIRHVFRVVIGLIPSLWFKAILLLRAMVICLSGYCQRSCVSWMYIVVTMPCLFSDFSSTSMYQDVRVPAILF